MLLTAGVQEPEIPLFDVVGSGASEAPVHIGATWVKLGVTFGFTTMVIVCVVAQSEAVGVKV